MIEDRYIELMHQEIDGELSEKDCQRLRKYLQSNPDAQSFYQDLRRASILLSEIPEFEPSPNLKKHIMNSVDFKKIPSQKQFSISFSRLRRFFTSPNPKLAYAFVVGIVIGFLLTSIFLGDFIQGNKIDISELYGTIGLKELENFSTLKSTPIDVSDIHGYIDVKQYRKIIVFKLALKSPRPFDAHLNYDPDFMKFTSFKPLSPSTVTLD
ncbi:MAG: hypothetical protein P8184_05800, partial [Calditrichia bacterium]